MAAITSSIRMRHAEPDRRPQWKADVLSEVAGLVIGFVTFAWIVASLNAL